MSQKRFTFAKIVILGGAGVGKTAFTVRYITKRYIGDYAPNTELYIEGRADKCEDCNVGNNKILPLCLINDHSSSVTASIETMGSRCFSDSTSEMMYSHRLVGSRDEVTLEIVDTAFEMPKDTQEKHIRWADGLILMYSVTDRHSYQVACKLKDTVFQLRGTDIPIVLVANKHDLLTARAVTEDECDNLAGEMDCPRFQISVAEGQEGVNETMEELLVLIKRQLVKSLSTSENVAGLEKKSRLFNMKKAFKKRIVRSRSDTF